MGLALAVALAAALPAHASFPGRNGLIAYSTGTQERGGAIYTATATGRDRRRLTHEGTARNPAWSRDGNTIAFDRTSRRGNAAQIYTMRANGSRERRVRIRVARAANPSWAPNGRRFAFEGCKTRGKCEEPSVFVVGRNGHGLRRIANAGRDPVWSPDGRLIAYYGPVDGSSCETLVVVRPSGAGRRTVIPPDPDVRNVCSGGGRGADFSPDGERLVYFGLHWVSVLLYDHAMYTVGVDGHGLRMVRARPADQGGFFALPLTWSPDGSSLLWRDDRGVHVGSPSGGAGRSVPLPTPARDFAWQPRR
jgi:Tol biopolymer transport system component